MEKILISDDEPTISVVIPLYNHEKYIDAAIDSLVAQSVPPDEIIVVDDGSQDGSFQRVQQRAHQDSRILCWSRPNKGAHATLNEAIERASGNYVAILNSDDCYEPTRLEVCLNALETKPGVSVVCTGLSFVNGAGKGRRNKWYEQARKFYDDVGDLSLALINGNFLMTTSNVFMKREVFDVVGPFANLRYSHDLDYFLRIHAQGFQILLLDDPLLKYRMHGSNTISEDVLKVKAEWAAVVASYAYSSDSESDWSYLGRMIEIADRHNLTRMLFMFFLYFRRTSTDKVRADSYLDAADFQDFLQKAAK